MTRTPKPKEAHPVEAFEADVIANAAIWTAVQHRGPFDRQKHEARTQAEAEAEGARMLADRDDKAVMIYAVNKEGRQALVKTLRAGRRSENAE